VGGGLVLDESSSPPHPAATDVSAPTSRSTTIRRHLIGELSLDDTHELLLAALEQQNARRAWIIEHWPHIVEYHELTSTVAPQRDTRAPTVEAGLDITD
jgi:hypothetical protein